MAGCQDRVRAQGRVLVASGDRCWTLSVAVRDVTVSSSQLCHRFPQESRRVTPPRAPRRAQQSRTAGSIKAKNQPCVAPVFTQLLQRRDGEYGDMQDETVLRESARYAIHHGRLPRSRPNRTTWIGSGDGKTCGVCGEAVSPDQIGMEITFNAEHLFQFHTKCFSAWERERDGLDREVRALARRVVRILVSATRSPS